MHQFNTKNFRIIGLLTLCLLHISLSATAQEDIHSRWASNIPQQTFEVDHSSMNSILSFITESRRKQDKYSYYKLRGKGLEFAQQYKTYLSSIPVSKLNKDEQLAYWLNLHNLLVIEKITLNIKQAKRLKNKRGTPSNVGTWWAEKMVSVEGVTLSIDDIEQHVLVQHWAEPLVLYGLFYGVKGQAFKGIEAFTGKTVNAQLASLATLFLNNDSNVDVRKSQVRLSSLLAWNKTRLFDDDDQKVLAHLRQYATDSMAVELLNVTSVSDKHDFDWKHLINSAPRKQTISGGASGGGYRGGS